jgi:PKD repeat protein
MKKSIFLLIIMFLAQNIFSQSFQWLKSGGGNGNPTFTGLNEQVKKIVVDNAGNSFIISDVSNFTNLASTFLIDGNIKNIPSTYINNDVSQGFIASFDCNGAYRWSKVITGQDSGYIEDVKLDSQGNVYFIGNLGLTANQVNNRFDTDLTLPLALNTTSGCNNCYSAYIAKYTNSGTFIWVKNLEPANRNINPPLNIRKPVTMHTLEIDNADNLYVFASIQRSTQVISGSYVNNYGTGNEQSNHILKYDSNGIFIEGKRLDYLNTNGSQAYKFYRNKQTGNFYIAGGTSGTTAIASAGSNSIGDGFHVAAFDPMGNYLWKIEDVNSFTNNYSSLAFDTDNNIYVTNGLKAAGGLAPAPPQNVGSFAGYSFEIDPNTSRQTVPFIIKLSPTGQGIWGKAPTSTRFDSGRGITINGNEVAIVHRFDNIIWDGESQGTSIFGSANEKVYPGIIRLNKETGEMIAMNRISDNPAAGLDSPQCMTADNLGNYYIGGELKTSMIVNGITKTNMGGNSDLFLMKYGTNNCNCQVPTCKFKATKTTTTTNVVNFKYQGQNVYTSVLWNFGDGTPTSNLVNPTHTYATAGVYNVCLTATNACDSYTYCHDINTTTLLQNNYFGEANDPKISIFPNPAENEVSIKFQSKYNLAIIEIYDLTGRLVDLFTTNDTKGVWTANISNLTPGVYTVVMKEEGKITMQEKLVKR